MTLYRAEYLERRARLLAEKPWEKPEIGDNAQNAEGKAYRHVLRFESTLGRVLSTAGPSRGFASGYVIVYENQHGREVKCYCTTWFGWCSKAVRDGGDYRRKEDEPR